MTTTIMGIWYQLQYGPHFLSENRCKQNDRSNVVPSREITQISEDSTTRIRVPFARVHYHIFFSLTFSVSLFALDFEKLSLT